MYDGIKSCVSLNGESSDFFLLVTVESGKEKICRLSCSLCI